VSASDIIALAGLACTVVIAGLAYAYKSGRIDARLDAIVKGIDDAARDTAAKVVERETRLGANETAVGVLFAWKNRLDGAQEERTRRDTRGVPVDDDPR
jgi:hypothetical protein